jgi:hypothetical protein
MKKLNQLIEKTNHWIQKAFGKDEEAYEAWQEKAVASLMKERGMSKEEAENWIQKAIKHPGALSKEYPGMAKNGKDEFTNAQLDRIAKKGGIDAKRANLAKTLKKFHKEQ